MLLVLQDAYVSFKYMLRDLLKGKVSLMANMQTTNCASSFTCGQTQYILNSDLFFFLNKAIMV